MLKKLQHQININVYFKVKCFNSFFITLKTLRFFSNFTVKYSPDETNIILKINLISQFLTPITSCLNDCSCGKLKSAILFPLYCFWDAAAALRLVFSRSLTWVTAFYCVCLQARCKLGIRLDLGSPGWKRVWVSPTDSCTGGLWSIWQTCQSSRGRRCHRRLPRPRDSAAHTPARHCCCGPAWTLKTHTHTLTFWFQGIRMYKTGCSKRTAEVTKVS